MKSDWRERIMTHGPDRDSAMRILLAGVIWMMVLPMCLPDSYSYMGPVTDGGEDNFLRRGLWLVLFAVSAVVLLLRLPMAWRVLRQLNIFYVLWFCLAVASVSWSVDSELTGRKLVRLTMMFTAFLAVAVAAWEPRRFQHLLRPVLTLVVVASIFFAFGWPDLALHHESNPELINAWHGVCLTKNQLGAVASFAFILWVHAWLTKEIPRIRAILGGAAAMLCLVMTRSQTSTIASVFGVAAMVIMLKGTNSRRRHAPLIISAIAGVLLLYAMAMLKVIPGLEIILEPIPWITGKDLTFSNRAQIWAVVSEHVQLRPMLGSGYGAFWLPNLPTPDKDSYFILNRLNGLYPGSSHNGYMQVLNDLGVVGLVFLLSYIFVFFRQSFRLYATNPAQGALFIGLLLQQATINMEEPDWLNSIIVDFVPMSVATFCLARALVEAKSLTPAGVKRGVSRIRRMPNPYQGRRSPAQVRVMRNHNPSATNDS